MSDTTTDTHPHKRAWVTLVTRASYIPGVVLLAHSLHTNASKFPLLILVTPSLSPSIKATLQKEAALTNSSLLLTDSLFPPPHNAPVSLITPRFEDTWTKLRVFELHKHGYDKLVFLDADMLVLQNMDELFDVDLSGEHCIASTHACVCNLDNDPWASPKWTQENCAFTGLSPTSPATTVPPTTSKEGEDAWTEPHRLLNSGMFIFTPHESQWKDIQVFLQTDPRVKSFLFPDQDFLAVFFLDRWKSVGWRYNALKTMRYWHSDMWDDGDVKNLHLIVDKPWSKRVGSDGVAGYLGRDGVTHSWWWREFERWEREREGMGEREILELMREEIAEPLAESSSHLDFELSRKSGHGLIAH